ncbi:MAG: hypothetical protein L6R41_001159 [Letrouitia leprolyta]|nr:MAG: hypothetical protein L6R41_001159 [Letrouitia leprolyta]
MACFQSSENSSVRPFLTLPDVIRERIYFFALTVQVDPCKPWITPLPSSRYVPKHLPGLPPEPNSNLENVSKWVRRKRRRKIKAFESIKQEKIAAARAVAPSSCLAILATCRAILLEAFHLWYKNNTLNFCRSEDLSDFLTSIGRVRANEIRSIRLDLPSRDWDDPKATHVLGNLLRLENLVFVYNGYSPTFETKMTFIGYPKIIGRLRGLQQVTFLNPENPKTTPWGHIQGMTPCVKNRMEELREKMMGNRKKPKAIPPMMDLFNRLRIADQKKTGTAGWNWEENFSYAPEIDGDNNAELSVEKSVGVEKM